MSNAECAKFLGIAPGTLNNWRVKKKGPTPHKVGGRIVYREQDAEIWLAKHREEGFEDDTQTIQPMAYPVHHGRKDVLRNDRHRGYQTKRKRREAAEMKEAEARLSRSNSH